MAFLTSCIVWSLLTVPALAAPRGEALEGNDKAVYQMLAGKIEQVAAGKLTSTVFTLTPGDLGLQEWWTAEELGVEAIVVGGSIAADAIQAMKDNLTFDAAGVINALAADYPCHLYWFDKTVGFYAETHYNFSAVFAEGEYKLGYDTTEIMMLMAVSEDYAGGTVMQVGGQSYPVELDAARREQYKVDTAFAAAQIIVADNSKKSDYDKLLAYRDAICALTAYNHGAADDPATPYGNPWQPIFVFDGDPATDVVCEGYAKAFKYLCDLTDFDGDIACRTVTGAMKGGTGTGEHMWNVVRMEDGNNYLVDLTNCDDGTIGAPDQLFLAGAAEGGVETGYRYACENGDIAYVYDADTLALFPSSVLTMSGAGYTPDPWADDGSGRMPYAMTAIRADSDSVAVDVVKNFGGTGRLIVAAYTADGRFLTSAMCDVSDSGEAAVTLDTAGAGRLSAFIVRHADMTPVSLKLDELL